MERGVNFGRITAQRLYNSVRDQEPGFGGRNGPGPTQPFGIVKLLEPIRASTYMNDTVAPTGSSFYQRLREKMIAQSEDNFDAADRSTDWIWLLDNTNFSQLFREGEDEFGDLGVIPNTVNYGRAFQCAFNPATRQMGYAGLVTVYNPHPFGFSVNLGEVGSFANSGSISDAGNNTELSGDLGSGFCSVARGPSGHWWLTRRPLHITAYGPFEAEGGGYVDNWFTNGTVPGTYIPPVT